VLGVGARTPGAPDTLRLVIGVADLRGEIVVDSGCGYRNRGGVVGG
jgi:hypothetical protein